MRVTFIIPCRNNLKYLKQAIYSIQEHYGNAHNIVVLDDASNDGTWEWISENLTGLINIQTYRNEKSDRVGHTILYDIGISMSTTDIVTILHSDMVVTKNYIPNLLKHMKKGVVVSGTRIEPPLHPPGPEKLVYNFGFEPEEFSDNKTKFEEYVSENESVSKDQITNGIFAPWMIYKEDFVSVGGHDRLFAPMELEDSDIFNRFVMAGYSLVQSRDAFVYHMTCRGSRFKDGIEIEAEIPLSDGTIWYKPKDSEEYKELRNQKFREWWRKWHSNVLHDKMMMPIVPNVYNTHFIVKNCTNDLLKLLEPFCDKIFIDIDPKKYLEQEQTKTMFDLSQKILPISDANLYSDYDVELTIDGNMLNNKSFNDIVMNLPIIVEESNETNGTFEFDSFQLKLNISEHFKTRISLLPLFKNVF